MSTLTRKNIYIMQRSENTYDRKYPFGLLRVVSEEKEM